MSRNLSCHTSRVIDPIVINPFGYGKAEKAGDQVAVDFSFAFDWLREWRVFFGLIKVRSKVNPKESHIIFGTQSKTALQIYTVS